MLLVLGWTVNVEPFVTAAYATPHVQEHVVTMGTVKDVRAQELVRSKKFSSSRSKAYARLFVTSPKQFKCLDNIWTRESHWNHKADNKHSSAFGIPQILGMTEENPYRQIDKGLEYIKSRYGTPCAAWRFWQRHNWY